MLDFLNYTREEKQQGLHITEAEENTALYSLCGRIVTLDELEATEQALKAEYGEDYVPEDPETYRIK